MKNDKIRVGFIGANPPTNDVPAQSPTRIGRQPFDVILWAAARPVQFLQCHLAPMRNMSNFSSFFTSKPYIRPNFGPRKNSAIDEPIVR